MRDWMSFMRKENLLTLKNRKGQRNVWGGGVGTLHHASYL